MNTFHGNPRRGNTYEPLFPVALFSFLGFRFVLCIRRAFLAFQCNHRRFRRWKLFGFIYLHKWTMLRPVFLSSSSNGSESSKKWFAKHRSLAECIFLLREKEGGNYFSVFRKYFKKLHILIFAEIGGKTEFQFWPNIARFLLNIGFEIFRAKQPGTGNCSKI